MPSMGLDSFLRRLSQAPPEPTPRALPSFKLDDHLPQPVDERIIAQKIGDLKSFLADHVDAFYRSPEGAAVDDREDDYSSDEEDDDNIPPEPGAPLRFAVSEDNVRTTSRPHMDNEPRDRVDQRVPLNQPEPPSLSWKSYVRTLISRAIISRIDPYAGDPRYSFLPREIVQFLRLVNPESDNEGMYALWLKAIKHRC
jgi:hypothetical protein